MSTQDWLFFFEEVLGNDGFSSERLEELAEAAELHEQSMNEMRSSQHRGPYVEPVNWEAKYKKLASELEMEQKENKTFRESFARKWKCEPNEICVESGEITCR